MLPCCRRGAGVAGAAHHDHDGYSDAPGRPVLPDGGTLHVSLTLRKNLKRRAAESPTSRSACFLECPVPFSHIHKLTLASLKRCLTNPFNPRILDCVSEFLKYTHATMSVESCHPDKFPPLPLYRYPHTRPHAPATHPRARAPTHADRRYGRHAHAQRTRHKEGDLALRL